MSEKAIHFLLFTAGVLFIFLIYLRMRPRRYYLVRHGETILNKEHIKQGLEGSLSELGKQQAKEVGAALAGEGIRLICSSTYLRARETAAIIRAALPHHPHVKYSPLLIERRNASAVLGRSTKDPEVVRIVDTIDLSYHADDYRYGDEENFLDLKARAKKCLKYLERQQALATCVITHHAFLKMLLASMLYRNGFNSADFVKLSYFNTSDNGGITACEYDPWHKRWTIEGYNETTGQGVNA